jgi:hypothetical protein
MSTDDRFDPDDLLSRALHDEAEKVQTDPAALQKIQQRTGDGGHGRSWLYAGIGAAAATAAIIAGAAVMSDNTDPSSGPVPATQNAPTGQAPTPDSSTPTSDTPTAVVEVEPTSLIYVGMATPRLFAEVHPVPLDDNLAVMNTWLQSTPDDPDYTTGWPAGMQVDTIQELEHGARLELSGPADANVADDPGLGESGGKLAITAMLFNGNFQTGEGISEATYNGEPLSTLLGVSLPFVLPADDDVRAFIVITSPAEGEQVSSPVDVDILGNVFEGNVNWQLLDDSGAKIDDGYVTTSMGDWTPATIHLGDLDPGTYTIRCLEYSPQNGKPGNVDDKTFTVE